MQEVNLIGRLSTGGSYVPVINPKTITENGTYTAPEGIDGYNPVTVNVIGGDPIIELKTITENGTYEAPLGVDGFSPVIVNVPPIQPVIQSKAITENGTYEAPLGVDGFSPVVVNVPSDPKILTNTFSSSNAGSMRINFNIDEIYTTWDGGGSIECYLSGNQDLKDFNTLTFNIQTGTSYYNTIGAHPIRELYFGVTETKVSVGTAPTSVNWLDYRHVHDDNTAYTFTIGLTELESEGIYVYISANGWNISSLQVSLS